MVIGHAATVSHVPGRSLRIVCLAAAAWAVLFAPAAVSGDADPVGAVRDADRFAAAVIAPTFGGSESFTLGRLRSDDGEDNASSVELRAAVVPAAAVLMLVAALAGPVPRSRENRPATAWSTAFRSRAPPLD